jgi:hypothetical protein
MEDDLIQCRACHGAGFGLNFAWVLLAAAIVAGNTNFFLADLTVPQ